MLPLALLLAPAFWSAAVPAAFGSDEVLVACASSRGVVALFGVVEVLGGVALLGVVAGVVSVVAGVVLMVPAPAPVVVLLPTPFGLVWLETPGEVVLAPASGVVLGVPCVTPVLLEFGVVPAAAPDMLLLLPVPEASVVLCVAVVPLLLPTGVELSGAVPVALPGVPAGVPVPFVVPIWLVC